MLVVLAGLAACRAASPSPPDWKPKTIAHLEARAQDWIDHTPEVGENFDCDMSCHTTHTFLTVRPLLGGSHDTFDKIRGKIEARVAQAGSLRTAVSYYGEPGSDKERESRATEAVLNAATLVFADPTAARPATRVAFDRMWELQREDGGFDWLDYDLEPWEAGGDFGATLAALTASKMPGHREEAAKLAAYLKTRELDLHDQVMLLRAKLADASVVEKLLAHQRSDGGWSLAEWGIGKRQDSHDSDAYATAFATLALCEAGHRNERGIAWLLAHRSADGSWTGRSVNSDDEINQLFMSDAATAYAALALVSCTERR